MRKGLLILIVALLGLTACHTKQSDTKATAKNTSSKGGRIESLSYTIHYRHKKYVKKVYVYVPKNKHKKQMNVLYYLHGSTGSGQDLAKRMKSTLDQLAKKQSALVVFPTYYPDASFVQSDYSADYPLNVFFA